MKIEGKIPTFLISAVSGIAEDSKKTNKLKWDGRVTFVEWNMEHNRHPMAMVTPRALTTEQDEQNPMK